MQVAQRIRMQADRYSVSDAARKLDVKVFTLMNWIKRGIISRPTHTFVDSVRKYYTLAEVEQLRKIITH